MRTRNIVFKYFKSKPLITLFTLLVIILSVGLTLLPPQVLRIIVDEKIYSSFDDTLFIWSLFYMGLLVSSGVIDFLKQVLLVIISQGIGKNLRLTMLKKVHRLNYKTFKDYEAGSLESYFSNDIDEINSLITSGVISMAIDGFKMIGIVVSIFIFSYIFGFVTMAIIPFIVIFTMVIRKGMRKAQKNNRIIEGNVNNMVLESIDNIRTIKTYRVYDSIYNKYDNVLNSYYQTNQRVNFYDAIFNPTMQTIKYTVIVGFLLLTGINKEYFGLSIGVIISCVDLLVSLFSPVENLGMEIQTIQKSIAAINRVNEFLVLPEDSEKTIHEIDISNGISLRFDDVTFSYDGVNNVIEDFNLELNGNDRLVLKGRSGSGKSTLFRLAYGLIKPDSGKVTINGYDTYLLDDRVKRKIFSIVYQDYFFSGGSIKSELTLTEDISDEKVYESLRMVGLDRITDINKPFVETDYSTGELALINIARAILLDSKIVFLDEMNSKIDQRTASKVIECVDKLTKDKLVLSINHYGELLSNSKILNME